MIDVGNSHNSCRNAMAIPFYPKEKFIQMKKKSVAIKSIAVKHPSKYYTNEMAPYADIPNIPVFWWRLWGINGRYLMDKDAGETVELMAVDVSREAIELAGKRVQDIDLILGSTCCVSGWAENPQQNLPGTVSAD